VAVAYKDTIFKTKQSKQRAKKSTKREKKLIFMVYIEKYL